jgi:hypothetical protein
MGRRFFLLVAVAVFFLAAAVFAVAVAVAFLAAALLAEVGFDVALFDVLLWAGAFAAGDGASPVSTEDWDWATAGDEKPGTRKRIPAKTATAKRRTQTLPTAESWHP